MEKPNEYTALIMATNEASDFWFAHYRSLMSPTTFTQERQELVHEMDRLMLKVFTATSLAERKKVS
jgi:hypothetical protein